jgi:hypothetical protein
MSPRETDSLLDVSATDKKSLHRQLLSMEGDEKPPSVSQLVKRKLNIIGTAVTVLFLFIVAALKSQLVRISSPFGQGPALRRATGPYKLIEHQTGEKLFDYYDFYQGADSIGSAGYQTYVDSKRAKELNLVNVTKRDHEEFIFMQSAAGAKGKFRESVRLEGKTRFNRGLFILNVAHMPSGCGVWPAFWMTDEEHWPNHGEIDILEGINTQSVVKTALHTSDSCSMYAHVPAWAKTGVWDTSTGLPDTFTGQPNYINRVEADNCWVMAPHQWANQGCVAVSTENGTIGEPMNEIGGGVYVLEWDPVKGYIRSWVFKQGQIPDNLQASMDTAGSEHDTDSVRPDPSEWPVPYAYFAIGQGSGCSNDHFQDMRLVFNLAFCGTVAGNRFFQDCPALSREYNVSNDSVLTCNAFIASEPESLRDAYWKIRGVYVYEREYERQSSTQKNKTTSN